MIVLLNWLLITLAWALSPSNWPLRPFALYRPAIHDLIIIVVTCSVDQLSLVTAFKSCPLRFGRSINSSSSNLALVWLVKCSQHNLISDCSIIFIVLAPSQSTNQSIQSHLLGHLLLAISRSPAQSASFSGLCRSSIQTFSAIKVPWPLASQVVVPIAIRLNKLS